MKNKLWKIINKVLVDDFFNGAFWVTFGNVVSKGLSLLASIFVARILGSEVYGEYGVIRVTINFLVLLSSIGLNYSIVKFLAQDKSISNQNISNYISSSLKYIFPLFLIVSLIFLVIDNYYSLEILNNPRIEKYTIHTIIIVLLQILSTFFLGVFSGLKFFKEGAKVNFISGLIFFVLAILLSNYFGLSGILIAFGLNHLTVFIFFVYFFKKKRNVNISELFLSSFFVKNSKIPSIVKFSIPIGLSEIVYAVTTLLYSVLLVKFSGFREVGLFNAANQWAMTIMFLPSVLSGLVLSFLTSENGVRSTAGSMSIFKKNILLNLMITSLLSLLFYLFKDFLERKYGADFVGFSAIFSVLIFSTIPNSLGKVCNQSLIAFGYNWGQLIFKMSRQFLILSISIVLLMNGLGAMALAWGILLGHSILTVIMILFITYVGYKKK